MSLEVMVEVQSVQLVMFLLSVCHVLVTVSEGVLDMTLLKLLRTALMLRQGMFTS